MSDLINKQLIDDGAVIGYKPNLEYNKSVDGSNDTETIPITRDEYVSNIYSGYTLTVQSFLENTPYTAITAIGDAISNIDGTLKRLVDEFKESGQAEYSNIDMFIESLTSGNSNYADTFLEYHMDNIVGSSIPELCYFLINQKIRLQSLQNTVKTLYYGQESITDETMQELDESYKRLITNYEVVDPAKINYLALVNDSSMNRAVITYASQVSASVCDIEDVIYKEDETLSTNLALLDTTKFIFDQTNQEVKDRNTSYNMQQSIATMKKTLYNYYDKRKDMLNFYSLAIESGSNSFLITKVQSFEDGLTNAITNVNRILIGNVYYLQSITNLETEKQYLRSIYKTINYN